MTRVVPESLDCAAGYSSGILLPKSRSRVHTASAEAQLRARHEAEEW